ncbi:alpha/beta fold hydrolase [Cryptosporangium aurantiacum]|uniref:Pimeloyl-ACP methyl ester carboxylesterase n=1 Tax=Cryptosporangium aurantiacum TaxID=134849 RepID=A0A1M7PM30_9ACTN|nr:alpha/beta fold hydrolase [Cryptosporangium aurantiacum]SHN18277.1 Pimeloyl-ACP methyl ester carboxylesterase [Cryptosporangium aurantiacum]
MRPTALVLVHGAQHAGDCWEPTVEEIQRHSPDTPVLAVDLPGRRGTPADLATVDLADWMDSVVEQIDAAGLDEVVVVGHSMAGITVPGAVARLGAQRVRRMILLGASVPPEGRSILDTLTGPLHWYAARAARRGVPAPPMPMLLARRSFCNGMTPEQRRFVLDRLYGDSSRIPAQKVSRADLPREIPRTWILTLRDRAQTPAAQRKSIEALGGVDEVVELDTGHDAMVSAPAELAALLVDRCRDAVSR